MAWNNNEFTDALGITYPIIQAGMAGGPTTPELISTVSETGGLGSLGAGYMSPELIKKEIGNILSLTNKPFAVNLFIPEEVNYKPSDIEMTERHLKSIKEKLQLSTLETPFIPDSQDFIKQVDVLLREKVKVFSFTFGKPDVALITEFHKNNTIVMGTATTVNEAVILADLGVDIIVAQGSEAGGHRGTFTMSENPLIGTMALIPQMVDQVGVPVIASGGIMDGRGIVAALALGAQGVQMGTAFLTCHESGAHNSHKDALLNNNEDSTVITRSFSGKRARGIKNQFIKETEGFEADFAPYPITNQLTKTIRGAAKKQNNPEFMSLWSGQGTRLSRDMSTKDLFNSLINEIEQTRQIFI